MDKIKVLIAKQGNAVPGEQGYMVLSGDDVVAFYLDGWGKTGRIYSAGTTHHYSDDGKSYPSIWLIDDEDDESVTEIYFPDFPSWDVHCVGGGKVMSICLTKSCKMPK